MCVTEPCGQHEAWQRQRGAGPRSRWVHPTLFGLACHPRALQSKHWRAGHSPLPLWLTGQPTTQRAAHEAHCLLVPRVCRWGWWFKRLIDVTVKAFHKLGSVIKAGFGSCRRLIIFLLSSHTFFLQQHYSRCSFIITATYCRPLMDLNLWSLIGLWFFAFIWLWLCKQCSWQGWGGCKQTLLKYNSVT